MSQFHLFLHIFTFCANFRVECIPEFKFKEAQGSNDLHFQLFSNCANGTPRNQSNSHIENDCQWAIEDAG